MVGKRRRSATPGEAKFRDDALGYDVLSRLETEAPMVDWKPDSGDEPAYEYTLFSRSGFTTAIEEAASEREDLHLFSAEDVVELLTT